MVRAGLIRQLGAGLWTYLPAGYRSIRKVEAILREEMEAIGAQEMLMPVLQPAQPWEETGRYAIDELFKLEDRRGAPMVLAMTHEECLTYHVAREVRSYRDLPLMLFHIQTKERDEPRPAGRGAPDPRVHDEGRLLLRPRRGGLAALLRAPGRGLREDLRPLRAALVPGRVRRRDDGRDPGPTSTWRRARPGRTRSRWRRATRPTSRSPRPIRSRSSCRPPLPAPEEVETPGLTTIERGLRATSAFPPGP